MPRDDRVVGAADRDVVVDVVVATAAGCRASPADGRRTGRRSGSDRSGGRGRRRPCGRASRRCRSRRRSASAARPPAALVMLPNSGLVRRSGPRTRSARSGRRPRRPSGSASGASVSWTSTSKPFSRQQSRHQSLKSVGRVAFPAADEECCLHVFRSRMKCNDRGHVAGGEARAPRPRRACSRSTLPPAAARRPVPRASASVDLHVLARQRDGEGHRVRRLVEVERPAVVQHRRGGGRVLDHVEGAARARCPPRSASVSASATVWFSPWISS